MTADIQFFNRDELLSVYVIAKLRFSSKHSVVKKISDISPAFVAWGSTVLDRRFNMRHRLIPVIEQGLLLLVAPSAE